MSTNDPEKPGVIAVAINGIQDISALLPLLATEQCESHVTSALERGFLYAAAAPMSIFGSLGIVKAGFVVLWTSIDYRWFPGPTLLHNAGFLPSGIGALLTCLDYDGRNSLYTAEDKLQRILANKHIQSVTVDPSSWDIFLWNGCLVVATVLLGSFGLLPHVFLITKTLPDQSFQSTWFYPILRVVGCGAVATNIQFILQHRILDEVYSRLRFMAMDRCIRKNGIPIPEPWCPSQRSKISLIALAERGFPCPDTEGSGPMAKNHEAAQRDLLAGLGKMSSFSFPQRRPSSRKAKDLDQAEKACVEPGPTALPTGYIRLCVCRFTVLTGMVLAVVGYIGCFSIVQASSGDSKGPLLWLVFEALLAIGRIAIWAWNPKWDDAKPPITLEKTATSNNARNLGGTKGDNAALDEKRSSYALGWDFKSGTADDMHALIVGIDSFDSPWFPNLKSCVKDASSIESYATDHLLVPRNQVVTLRDSKATKKRIFEELDELAQRSSVEPNAPILIYFATHSFQSQVSGETYLVPYDASYHPPGGGTRRARLGEAYISYPAIVTLLRRIAEEKTNNITLIIDTCHAGAFGDFEIPNPPPHNLKFDSKLAQIGITMRGLASTVPLRARTGVLDPLSPNSHIVLCGTSAVGRAFEQPRHSGGLFTSSLLEALTENPKALESMTYKGLIKETNRRMQEKWKAFLSSEAGKSHSKEDLGTLAQKACCTGSSENLLVFNGLLSRKAVARHVRPVITVQYSDQGAKFR